MDYLKQKPYELNDEAINWVRETIQNMTIEEKAAQLFIVMNHLTDENDIHKFLTKYPVGGIRYRNKTAEEVYKQNTAFQKYSKVPIFIAANCENGADEVCKEGTFVASEAELGATDDLQLARKMGSVCGSESEALGINWTFSPIVDVYKNSKNTIVNSRAYGSNPDKIISLSRAYMQGVHNHNLLTCAKHFPGDGVDDRDQHLLMAVNDMTWEEWEQSSGKIYRTLIEEGLESIMVGHIALPAYVRKRRPDIPDQEILPASLSKELIRNLLREEMGFRGLVITDASHMGGLLGAMPRKQQVPGVIAAGCDMFLFSHDMEEDFQYMIEGISEGVISEARLQEALEHILGMKARLGMYKKKCFTSQKKMNQIGCSEHRKVAEKIAEKGITLVKDVENYLPLNPKKQPRAKLYFLESEPETRMEKPGQVKQIVVKELEQAGFQVDAHESLYELEWKEVSEKNIPAIMQMPSTERFKANYDVVFVFIYMHGYARENSVRLKYSFGHSNELPWWIREVPTIGVSLNFTNHLYDMPMLKCYINAYAPSKECIHAAVQKIVGSTKFEGKYDETVWCGRWDTRI